MRKNLRTYLGWVAFMFIMQVVFMIAYGNVFGHYSILQNLTSLLWSIPQSLSVAAWVMLVPAVAAFVHLFIRGNWFRWVVGTCCGFALFPVLLFTIVDLVLYYSWGFRLDDTFLVYVLDDPETALAGMGIEFIMVGMIALCGAFGWWIARVYRGYDDIVRFEAVGTGSRGQYLSHGVFALAMGMLAWGGPFINNSTPYHSCHQDLNQASVNPVYSFFHALQRAKVPVSERYLFMNTDECEQTVAELLNPESMPGFTPDSTLVNVLKESRPNVLFLMFESWCGSKCNVLYPEGAEDDIMPNFNAAMREGLQFSNYYSNSIRTDRALVCALSAFPSVPTATITPDKALVDKLPAGFAATMRDRGGYQTAFLYGGDVNFVGQRYFLEKCGFDTLRDKADYPESQWLCQWGVHDDVTFADLSSRIIIKNNEIKTAGDTLSSAQDSLLSSQDKSPFFWTFLNLSSHEPFVVPFKKFDDPYTNCVAFSDHEFGKFLSALKADTATWNHLLIIATPDHCHPTTPKDIEQCDPLHFHSPMFWTGGALRDDFQGQTIETLCQQTDITATLLRQLGISSADFPFSHDIFNPAAPHFAFYAWPDGFGMLMPNCTYIQDNNYDGHGLEGYWDPKFHDFGTNDPEGKAQRLGKAYLQTVCSKLR